MLFGITITPLILLIGGGTLLTLLVLQVLVGQRRIKFKGALHMRVHRWIAYAMLAFAAVHALAALAYLAII